ncbi:sodium:proton antiporter isoform A [Micractinium conductrix]|uniref:Sodium:proton antiporter isoform A n=1 Tax=Micractinium conductrix TaxID=554055 RepID=A0A2P6VE95_9CHLO|nr:sodium:proton antiporter isoform A [Micractinium conductrix]|eukprot:PSC72406.1 sodium:proton antiporter isoform A [Micractinium conductrix]
MAVDPPHDHGPTATDNGYRQLFPREGLADDDVMPSSTTASPTKSMGATAAEVENEETVPICPACGKAAIIINK